MEKFQREVHCVLVHSLVGRSALRDCSSNIVQDWRNIMCMMCARFTISRFKKSLEDLVYKKYARKDDKLKLGVFGIPTLEKDHA